MLGPISGCRDHFGRIGVGAPEVGWQESDVDWVESGDAGADKYLSGSDMDQVGAHQYVEVGGAAEGAAALCGGGEPEQVGDRSRADGGGPVPANVWVVGAIGGDVGIGGFPGVGGDDGPLSGGSSDGTRGSARVRRGLHNGRTIVVGSGRCRDLIHDQVISNNAKQRQWG